MQQHFWRKYSSQAIPRNPVGKLQKFQGVTSTPWNGNSRRGGRSTAKVPSVGEVCNVCFFKNCKTDAVIIRILTDVSAILPSSGYTRLNTVKKFVKISSRAWWHTRARATWNSAQRRGSKQKKNKTKKQTNKQTNKQKNGGRGGGWFTWNINLISYFLRYSWLARPAFNTAMCMICVVYDLVGWSGQVQEGHSSRWWYLCGVLENGPPTCVQSPQCTLSMDTWCTTSNKPRVQWCRKNVPWCKHALWVFQLWMMN